MIPREGIAEAGEGARGRGTPAWHTPRVEQHGLQRYMQVLRERFRWIVLAVLVTTLAAGVYLALAEETYEAQADLLVTPLSDEDTPLAGLGLIRESADPTRDVETAARLATSRDVAELVRRKLRLDRSPGSLLENVDAAPVAQSNIVAITATANEPRLAAQLANGFGEAVVEDRTRRLHAQLDKAITRLRRQVESLPTGQQPVGPDSAADQLAQLQTLRSQSDPTLRLETRADEPDGPASPKRKLTLAAGLLAGLILGVGGAFALHALDPRLRREDQLRELYRLPVLARIPKERRAPTETKGRRRWGIGPKRKHRRALGPGQLSPVTQEAYRTLRAMLAASRVDRGEGGRSVLVTGPSPSEGKTTTAINLASSLALAGNQVILIEADFRRPTVAETLGVKPTVGIGKVLLGRAKLEDALVSAHPFGGSLRLLVADRADEWLAETLSLPTAARLLEQAEALADYVVIDSPPLTEVIDALPLAQQVDDVILVVRLGASNLGQLSRLGDLLAQNGIRPSGFAVVGVGRSDEDTYYVSGQRARLADQATPDGEPRVRAPSAAG